MSDIFIKFWRRWGKIISYLLGAGILYICGLAFFPKPTKPIPITNPIEISAIPVSPEMKATAIRMAAICHAWMRLAKTDKDSAIALQYVHLTAGGSDNRYCLNWLVLAGEPAVFPDLHLTFVR